MARLIHLKTITDARGSLTVVEREAGFPIKRVFYIYDVKSRRGGHGHKRTKTALIALNGEVRISGQTPAEDFDFTLTSPDQCLLLEKEDWHQMDFGPGSVLLVLASEEFQHDDYVFEKYRS